MKKNGKMLIKVEVRPFSTWIHYIIMFTLYMFKFLP